MRRSRECRPPAPRRAFSPGCAAAIAALLLAGCAIGPHSGSPHPVMTPVAVDQGVAVRLLSDYRQAHGLGAVEPDAALTRVAQRQADAMAAIDRIGHDVAGTLSQRLAAEGAERMAAAENVSAGYDTLEQAVAGWRASPPHDANLLFAPIRRFGIAGAFAPGTRFKTFWALVMTD